MPVYRSASGNNALWLIAGMLIAVVIGGGILYANGWLGDRDADINVNIDLPKVRIPAD
ncbi:MAG: hypothetical protein AB7L41_01720 [Flavobacteriaceae bacterium]